jgi:hypothetical protein
MASTNGAEVQQSGAQIVAMVPVLRMVSVRCSATVIEVLAPETQCTT